jgi:hypothetical protein
MYFHHKYMKQKKILLLPLIISSLCTFAQASIRLYAYSQVVTPGMAPKGVIDENGNALNTKKEFLINYYIFAVYNSSAKISFGEIWIKGKFYNTQIKNVDSTPVISTNENIPGNQSKEILVPATKLKVISIMPGKTKNSSLTRSSSFIKMTRRAELIVSYIYHGKKHFIEIKKIKLLQPVAGV